MSGMKRNSSSLLERPIVKDDGISRVVEGEGEGEYTSLRRTTRSILSKTTDTTVTNADSSSSSTILKKLDVAKFAYIPSPRKRVKVEASTPLTPKRSIKVEHVTTSTTQDEKSPKKAKTKAKAMPLVALTEPHPAPHGWEEQYRLIEKMRKSFVAPVDDMGCERPQTAVTDPKTTRFHILISLMLSSQTKDAITSSALTLLHTTLPGGLTAESLASAPVEVVEGCINKVGFWRRKAEYIQAAAKTLLQKQGDEKGDVPKTIEGLCELKGVGPKMAFLALQCAWDINAGIGVDVHVHRITNRLSWHRPLTKTPEQTRINLESWLPLNYHKAINPLLVGFGQVICLPIGPRCDICLLAKKGLCPSAQVVKKGRKEISYDFEHEQIVQIEGAKVQIKYEDHEHQLQKIDDVDDDREQTTTTVKNEESVVREEPLRQVQVEMVKKETEW